MAPDPGDAVGDRNVGQTSAGSERILRNAGDWQAVGRVWDRNRTAGTCVSGYGYCAVIGGEKELGQRRARENEEQEKEQQLEGEGGS